MNILYSAVQRQTTVTAQSKNEPLLLFAFALQWCLFPAFWVNKPVVLYIEKQVKILHFVHLYNNLCSVVDHCSSNPCTNGDCHNTLEGFLCTCFPGFTGPNCQTGKIMSIHPYNSNDTLCGRHHSFIIC